MVTVGHTADWHLAAQGAKLDPETGLNARLMDRYRCARFVIEDALRREADLIVHCGDAFDRPRPTPTEVRLFRDAVMPALVNGIPMVLLLGNHDMPRSPVEKHALDLVRDMPRLRVVDRPCLLNVWSGPEGVIVDPLEMATPDGRDLVMHIACLPWPNKQLLLASEENRNLEPGALNLLVRERMMDVARGLAAQRIEGVPTILAGHFSVDMAEAGAQNRLMMLGGEWTLNLHELAALGFDAILLGHIHKPQMLHSDPPVAYSGSPEACTFGEEGEAKLYHLVEISDQGVLVEPIATPYRRLVTIDAGDQDAVAEIPDGAIVRLRLPQAMADQQRDLVRALEAAGAFEVRVEVERAETVRRREAAVSHEMPLDEAIRAWLKQKPELEALADELIAEALKVEAAVAGEGVST